jgi:hypothetical protein
MAFESFHALSQQLSFRSRRNAGRPGTARLRARPRLESLEDRTLPAGSFYMWTAVNNGSWTTAANWNLVSGPGNPGGFPNAQDDTAQFTTVAGAVGGTTVTIPTNTNITVGTIDFNAPNVIYRIVGGQAVGQSQGSLTFSSSGSSAALTEEPPGGAPPPPVPQQEVAAPMVLASTLTVTNTTPIPTTTFFPTPNLLVLSGNISDATSTNFGVTVNAGVVKFTGTDTYTGTTTLSKLTSAPPVDFVVGAPQGSTNPGSLAGPVLMSAANATLNGNGSIGGLTVNAGTVSPSGRLNSTGTLSSTGDVTFTATTNAGLITNINQSGSADIITAPANAITLNNTPLLLIPSVALVGTVGQQFTILQAATLTGIFTDATTSAPLPDGTMFTDPTSGFEFTIHYTTTQATLTLDNGKTPTTTTLVSVPPTTQVGNPYTLTANVTANMGTPPTTSTVTFSDNTTGLSLGTINLNPSQFAQFTVNSSVNNGSSVADGAHLIQATYNGTNSGNPLFAGGFAFIDQEVTDPALANPTLMVSGAPNPSNPGANVVVTATVTPPSGFSTAPTGRVDFLEGNTYLGSSAVSTLAGVTTASITLKNLASGLHHIKAVYSGDTTYNPVDTTLTQDVLFPTSMMLGSSPNPSNPNQTVTFTAQVSGGSVGTPGGNVTFLEGGMTLGTAPLMVVGGINEAVFTDSSLSTGGHTITASYAGDNVTFAGSSAQTSQKVRHSSTTTVSGSPNPSIVGQSVTLTAIVSPNGSSNTPVGTVTFSVGGTTLGMGTLMVVGGIDEATINTTALPAGNDTITASYSGDTNNFAPSTGMNSVTVNLDPTTTKVTASPNPSVYGDSVTLTATVSSSSAGTPGGIVTFSVGSLSLGTGTLAVVGGMDQATITTTLLPGGSDTITATYGGDGTFAGSSGNTPQTVNLAGSTTTVSAMPQSSTFGMPVTFTAIVSGGSAGTPGGIVTFSSGGLTLGTAMLMVAGGINQATFTTTMALPAGIDTITATYAGDGNFTGSAGTTVETVTATTTTTVSGQPQSSTLGTAVTFTAIVSGGLAGTPGGSVTFSDGNTVLGTSPLQLVGGVNEAVFTTSTLSVGSHTITASFADSFPFTASSGTATVTVNPVATTTTLASSIDPSLLGQDVTFTAVVSTSSGTTPTGSVTFADGSTALQTVALTSVNGVQEATFTTSGLALGSHSITATYNPATNTLASSAQSLTQVVKPVGIFAIGADAGGGPDVRVFDAQTGAVEFDFFAYDPNFHGGVRVAIGDVNGDGIADIITGPGAGGGPEIKVYDGATGAVLLDFMAFSPNFTGGVFVAAGDVNGDGHADIIVGADAGGGPEVAVFSGANGSLLNAFFPYDPNFQGGVRVAAGDLTGSGRADIITAAGPGGGPHIEAFDALTPSLVLRSFFAYDPNFTGGVYVGAGDVNGDGKADIITGAGPGGGPQVTVFSGANNKVLQSFFAYSPLFPGGVRVGAVDVNGDGKADILTGAGPGGGPQFNALDGVTLAVLDSFFAYDPNFPGGIYVGGGQ